MNSNMTRVAMALLERRLMPEGEPAKLSQTALERELSNLQRNGDWGKPGRWKARIELSLPRECEGDQ